MVQRGDYQLGTLLKERREALGLGIRELARLIEKHPSAGMQVSAPYYCQVENGAEQVKTEKISIDFFWAVGSILKINPLTLFVLSRPHIPQHYMDAAQRKKLFEDE